MKAVYGFDTRKRKGLVKRKRSRFADLDCNIFHTFERAYRVPSLMGAKFIPLSVEALNYAILSPSSWFLSASEVVKSNRSALYSGHLTVERRAGNRKN
jgi:hypothetical protein